MSKRLKSVVAVLVALTLCVSMLSGIFAAQAAYTSTIDGTWPSGLKDEWMKSENVSDDQKQATVDAVEGELVYQNDVLSFKVGTTDTDGTSHKFEVWDGMLCVQFENYDSTKTDNVGNPWNQTDDATHTKPRLWSVIIAPFPGMAFSVKGQLAAKFDNYGDSALGNEFTHEGSTYQLRFNNTHVFKDGNRTAIGYFPGSIADNEDGANNTFRYAVAKYNQDNKEANINIGYAPAHAKTTTDGKVFYQAFTGSQGTSYVAINASAIAAANLEGAYVIPADLSTKFVELGDTDDARFAITGAPLSGVVSGVQEFENGKLSAAGFKSGNASIDSFSIENEPKAAVIDHTAGTVTAYVVSGTDVTAITPNIEHNAKSIAPAGAQDFTNPVKYTLTADDDTTKEYTVRVVALSGTDINSFAIDDTQGVVDNESKTVTIVVPANVDLSKVTPVITAVDAEATVSPAGETDLSNSWDDGVKFTVTSGSDTAEYTVKARNKSADTSITSFAIEKDSLEFADSDVKATIDKGAKTISMVYPYGNVATTKVPAVVAIAKDATISPDPTAARDQSTAKYTVTSENGDKAEYTVKVTISSAKALDPIDKIEFELKNQWNGFKSDEEQESLRNAILDEYNHQRSLGFDLGAVVGVFENWDDLMNRLGFTSPMSTGDVLGQFRAMITADIPDGLAYTVKNDMANIWQQKVDIGLQGFDGFGKTGGAAENEFTMDGKTYQQFTLSYGVVSTDGNKRILNGIGTTEKDPSILNPFIASIQGTSWAKADGTVEGGVNADFRKAYELSNVYGMNPGVALDGNIKHNDEHDFMYQVFTGTDDTKKTTRDSSKKSIILSAAPETQAFVMSGDFQTIYENIPDVDFVDLTLDGYTFKYSEEIGLPTQPAFFGENGELVLQFEDMMASAPADDLTNVTVNQGSYYSSEAKILAIEFEDETKDITINHEDKRIDVEFKGKIDPSNAVIKSITISEGATSTNEAGSALDFTYDSDYITVTAEDGTAVTYDVYATYEGSDDDDDDDDDDNNNGDGDGNPTTGQNAGVAALLMVIVSGGVMLATGKSKKAQR